MSFDGCDTRDGGNIWVNSVERQAIGARQLTTPHVREQILSRESKRVVFPSTAVAPGRSEGVAISSRTISENTYTFATTDGSVAGVDITQGAVDETTLKRPAEVTVATGGSEIIVASRAIDAGHIDPSFVIGHHNSITRAYFRVTVLHYSAGVVATVDEVVNTYTPSVTVTDNADGPYSISVSHSGGTDMNVWFRHLHAIHN